MSSSSSCCSSVSLFTALFASLSSDGALILSFFNFMLIEQFFEVFYLYFPIFCLSSIHFPFLSLITTVLDWYLTFNFLLRSKFVLFPCSWYSCYPLSSFIYKFSNIYPILFLSIRCFILFSFLFLFGNPDKAIPSFFR